MRKQKRLFAYGLIGTGAVLTAALSAFIFSKNDEQRITDFVIDNQAELEALALNCLDGTEETSRYKDAKIDGVYSGESPVVQFHYSGSGLGPSSAYYGFYYSRDNVPCSFQNTTEELVSTSDNEWTWNDGTDNGGLTRKITDG